MRLVIHHTDADGHLAGAIAYHALRHYYDVITHEFEYGDPVPMQLCDSADFIYLVDISLPPQYMEDFREKIVWLDHHKSAIEKLSGFEGKQDTTKSGCLLTWEYFHPEAVVPQIVKYVNMYDMWQHEGNLRAFAYENVARLMSDVKHTWWLSTFTDREDLALITALHSSHVIDTDREILKKWASGLLDGHKVFLTYAKRVNQFEMRRVKPGYDIYARASAKDAGYAVSLFSETVPTLPYALKHGGGGHEKACGCCVNHLLDIFDTLTTGE